METERMLTPEEKFEEAAFELAIYRQVKREAETFLTPEQITEADGAAKEALPRMLQKIDKMMRKQHFKRKIQLQSLRAIKVAALIILIVNMAITVAVATSSEVRAQVIRFLMEFNDSYVEMRFVTTGEAALVPEDWPELYFPTYIPDGYTVQEYFPIKGMSRIVYANAAEQLLFIDICGVGASEAQNVEGAEISSIELHGVTATVLRQPYGQIDIIWMEGDHFFVVSSAESYETALAVAQSVERIQK